MKSILNFLLVLISLTVYSQTNTFMGASAGQEGTANSHFGYVAGRVDGGKYNTFIGANSGERNDLGTYNTFIGRASGSYNTGTSGNTFVGGLSGHRNTTGNSNSFLGFYTGFNNTSGTDNTFLGNQAGQYNKTGRYNTFVGRGSGFRSTASHNTFVGRVAGYNNSSGMGNTYLGSAAGYKTTTSSYNLILGYYSGFNMLTGVRNVIMGSQSGYSNTNGSYNVFLGERSGFSNKGSNNVFLGRYSGYHETASNRLYIDNTSTSDPLIYGKFDTNQVGINTGTVPNGYAFAVNGKMITEEVKVQLYSAWPDYVFYKNYNLRTLAQLENFILKNGHLPNIPSAEAVSKDGISLGDMNAKLLEKIEELTLYIIQQEKKIKASQSFNASLENRLLKLEGLVKKLNNN